MVMKVIFSTNGGNSIENQNVLYGGKATRPSTDPTKENYIFTGWYTEEEDGEKVESLDNIDGDISITNDNYLTIMYNNIGMIRYVYYLKISRMPLPSDGSLPFGILQRDKNGNRSTAYFKGGNQSDF